MTTTREALVAFWREIARRLSEGEDLTQAVGVAGSSSEDSSLAQAAADLCRDEHLRIEPQDAFAKHPRLFGPAVYRMVLAGATARDLAHVSDRIADAIEDGSFPVAGEPSDGNPAARDWRALGHMLSCSVPLVDALGALAERAGRDGLASTWAAVRRHVLEGSALSTALRQSIPSILEEVVSAVGGAEGRGEFRECAFRVADAMEEDDFSALWPPADVEELRPAVRREPARGFVNTVILVGIQQRASDIHFDPTGDDRVRVRLRVDGVLRDFDPPKSVCTAKPPDVPHSQIAARIKTMAGMDVSQNLLPQDGRIKIQIAGRAHDLRASSLPSLHGERICLRILPTGDSSMLDLERIGLLEDDAEKVRALCERNSGIVLAAGPTGSGKTTLFYSMLKTIDRDRRLVISVEDPVEHEIAGVAQTEIRPQIGRTFPQMIRHIFRQDPDVILIGEIRDPETANLCVQVAMTGHLVLTTLHAETAPGGVKRLLDMGLEPFMVNSTVAGVISQRLVRVLCEECKEECEPPLHSLPPEAADIVAGMEEGAFFSPRGCDRCTGSGYRGLTAIHEILIPDDRFKEAVASAARPGELRKAAQTAGMRSMLACGLEKAARGITSVQEVIRVQPFGVNE